MMRVSLNAPFANKNLGHGHFGGIIADCAGELYVQTLEQTAPAKWA
jgi:hypothetical protein